MRVFEAFSIHRRLGPLALAGLSPKRSMLRLRSHGTTTRPRYSLHFQRRNPLHSISEKSLFHYIGYVDWSYSQTNLVPLTVSRLYLDGINYFHQEMSERCSRTMQLINHNVQRGTTSTALTHLSRLRSQLPASVLARCVQLSLLDLSLPLALSNLTSQISISDTLNAFTVRPSRQPFEQVGARWNVGASFAV
jgi:hypothetical protein